MCKHNPVNTHKEIVGWHSQTTHFLSIKKRLFVFSKTLGKMRTPTVHHHRKNKNGKSKSLHGGLCSDDALRDKSDTLAGHYDKQ